MAFGGFNKNSGPAFPPKTHVPFGNFPQTQSPEIPVKKPISPHQQQTPRLGQNTDLVFDNSSAASQRKRTPNLAFESKNYNDNRHYPLRQGQRPAISLPKWENQLKSPINEDDFQARQQPPTVSVYSALHDAGTRFPTSPPNFQLPKRTRSPPLPSADETFFGTRSRFQGYSERTTLSPHKSGNQSNSPDDANFQTNQWPSSVSLYSDAREVRNRFPIKPPNLHIREGARSPPLPYADEAFLGHLHSSQDDTGRPAVSPPGWVNRPKSPVNAANFQVHQQLPSVSAYVETHDGGANFPAAKLPTFHTPKSARSPPVPSANEAFLRNPHSVQDDAQRPAVSPPKLGNRPKSPANDTYLQARQGLPPVSTYVEAHDGGTNFPAKPSNFQLPKRARSSPVPSANQASLGNSRSPQDDIERENQAKAKRLARFNVELSQPVLTSHDLMKNKVTGNKLNQNLVERRKFLADHPVEGGRELTDGTILTDYEWLEPSNVVIGICPEMCPEPEREERERKGDLDKYERLDGERNQTSKVLAVKKYNRTAEREPHLIRPMPVLQKTVDYLLDLLDQPYDDKFLGMYNFLWDRMRAIRMDLRMQHIFSRDAITMLEQMIRLHVIAMHELCEYTKGEGFSEGFDAHLNIEQMNKTSVELFQMYDDHRKKGTSVPTEKEFRGYYALLKLDRHPGYKVEPAEFSLDLAKMTPEIRCTSEILFARDVARACRTSNFIAFFRLAKKATYLQACLMHAHFAKLRSQALASLHSGLQNNQGIPIARIIKWLGMEEEDIESLLEYHGFLIKKFEVEYMVKEGPFLNGDKEYESKCSRLVHLKKSRRIIDDVSSGQLSSSPSEGPKIVLDKVVDKFDQKVDVIEPESLVDLGDEEMPDYEDNSAPRHDFQVWPMLKKSSLKFQEHEKVSQLSELGLVSSDDTSVLHRLPTEIIRVTEPVTDVHMNSLPEGNLTSTIKGIIPQIEASKGLHSHNMVENPLPQILVMKKHTENEGTIRLRQQDEASDANLKLILRIWKRRASKLREFREHRQLVANAAMNSLSLGLPIRQNKEQPRHSGEFNIDHVVRERHYKYGISWLRLNVSELIGPILREQNQNARCLCWKLVLCSQVDNTERSQTINFASTWLISKLMSTGKEDSELAASSTSLSIWKKWIGSGIEGDQTCCLSVIRDAAFENDRPIYVDDLVAGAGAILFLVSENNPWELQRIRLHNLILSLPSGSRLPLLILYGGKDYQEISDPSLMIIDKLGLSNVDKTRINNFSVVSLVENWPLSHSSGFYSDDKVREGLKWLANQSPAQPVLRQVKTRDLVLSYLGASLEVLDNMNISEVGPDHCITAFNEALDRTAEEIVAAAEANHVRWPSPEIDLLGKSSKEHRAVNIFVPSVGWSSDAMTRPIVSKLKSCKMPRFAQELSWLNHGSDMGKEVRNQKLALERCLNWYLTQESKIMCGDLAANEASVMLQKGATLVLDGSNYCIVPRWVVIFRRVFNWRLMNIADGSFSVAYVLKQNSWPNSAKPFYYPSDISTPLKSGVTESNVCMKLTSKSPDNKLSPYVSTELSLDEMVEVASLGCFRSESEGAVQRHSGPTGDAQVLETTRHSKMDSEDFRREDEIAEAGGAYLLSAQIENNGSRLVSKGKEADKLSMLLEQCNLLQDKIDEKLAIYF